MEKKMMIEFQNPDNMMSMTNESIGLAYRYTNPKYHVYEVIDENLFFLSVIKYGLEFRVLKYCSM